MVDEPALIQRAIQGEPKAFEDLVAPYQSQLSAWLGYVLGEDGEDCLQEVMLTAWQKLPQLKEPERFKGWLFQVARNRYMDYLRHKQQKNQVETPLESVVGYLGRMQDFESTHRIEDLTDAERQAVWMQPRHASFRPAAFPSPAAAIDLVPAHQPHSWRRPVRLRCGRGTA